MVPRGRRGSLCETARRQSWVRPAGVHPLRTVQPPAADGSDSREGSFDSGAEVFPEVCSLSMRQAIHLSKSIAVETLPQVGESTQGPSPIATTCTGRVMAERQNCCRRTARGRPLRYHKSRRRSLPTQVPLISQHFESSRGTFQATIPLRTSTRCESFHHRNTSRRSL